MAKAAQPRSMERDAEAAPTACYPGFREALITTPSKRSCHQKNSSPRAAQCILGNAPARLTKFKETNAKDTFIHLSSAAECRFYVSRCGKGRGVFEGSGHFPRLLFSVPAGRTGKHAWL